MPLNLMKIIQRILRSSLFYTALNLELVALRRLQNATAGVGLLGLAPAASARTHLKTVGVDKTIPLQGSRVPLGGGDGVDVEHVHSIDLLKRTVLGLDHEEVHDPEEEEARNTEDKTVVVVNAVGDESRDERDDEVKEPVGRSGEGHASRAVASWVKLTNDSPDERSPGGRETDDEQASENDHDVTGGRGGDGSSVLIGVGNVVTDEGVDEQTQEHPRGTTHHCHATTDVLDDPETTDGGDDVDGTENNGGDVGVLQTGSAEDDGAVVEEVVGSVARC